MKVITREVKKIENLVGSISENIIDILEIEKNDSPELIEAVRERIRTRVGDNRMKTNISLEDFIEALDFYTQNADLVIVLGPFNTLKMRQLADEKGLDYKYLKSQEFLNLKNL